MQELWRWWRTLPLWQVGCVGLAGAGASLFFFVCYGLYSLATGAF